MKHIGKIMFLAILFIVVFVLSAAFGAYALAVSDYAKSEVFVINSVDTTLSLKCVCESKPTVPSSRQEASFWQG
jgi:hypothetical protein